MSLGLHIATNRSITLSAISKHLSDTHANFATVFGSTNDRASITSCHTTKQNYEVVSKLHITLISNNQHNEENIKPGRMKANTNIHEFLKEHPMHCYLHPHYQGLIKQHPISSRRIWQAPRPSLQTDVNLPLQSTTRYTYIYN